MNPRIFISRELDSESVFLKTILSYFPTATIHGISLIDFAPLAFELPEKVDGCFFYSSKGVLYFLRQVENAAAFLEDKYIGAFGAATARILTQAGLQVDLIGDGNPKAIAARMLPELSKMSILFPQGTTSQNSLQPFLEGELEYLPLKVYDNQPKEIERLADYDIYVFTSPMNVKSFAAKNNLNGKQILSIGHTTAKAITEYFGSPPLIAERPYERELAEAVIKALKS